MSLINKYKNIYVAGHAGMLGSAITRRLKSEGVENIITRTRNELDLTIQSDVENLFKSEKIDCVFLVAARVGGIKANMDFPAEFIYENMSIQNNIIHYAYKYGVKKLIFVATSSLYPKSCGEMMAENYILSGKLETTDESYSVAKLSGIKMCQFYKKQYGFDAISVIPCNIYGLKDKYIQENGNVIPALLDRIHNAKTSNDEYVEVWGSGKPMREFIFSEDCADGLVFLADNYSGYEPINIGVGNDITIKELVKNICDIVGFTGKIDWNADRPDGIKRKLLDSTKINNLGWHAKTDLKIGLQKMYSDFLTKKD
ncbi:MAG: GDP-L-fucose synthase family protein [Alphaproteobacteria bacterium]